MATPCVRSGRVSASRSATATTRTCASPDSPVFCTGDQVGQPTKRIAIGGQIHGAHIGPAGAQGRQQRHVIAEDVRAQNLRQDVLEGSIATVDDEEIDFLAGEVRQRLGHDARIFRFDVNHVRMATQESEHPVHGFLALACSQIVDDTDSQFGCVLFVTQVRDMTRLRNRKLVSGPRMDS